MAVEWFFQSDDGTIGPLTTAQLCDAVARGQVKGDTKVRRGYMQKWVRTESIKGLFPSEEAAEPEEETEGRMSRPLLVTLIALPVIGLVVAVLVIVNYKRSREQARVEAADAKVAEAVGRAEKWLGGDKASDPEADLVSALGDERARNKSPGEAALQKVRGRKADVAADRLLDDARQALDKDQIPAAAEKLQAYIAGQHGTQKPAAQKLLSEIAAATSADAAAATLTAMPDQEYQEFKRTRQLLPPRTTHPAIVRCHVITLLAVLPAADRKREAERLALLERQKAAADAAAEAAREAPLNVFLGGAVRGKDAVMWREPMKFYEVPWTKPKSEFDQPDKYESKYNLHYITLAPGVQMMLSVKNVDKFFGTEWTWIIHAASPASGRPRFCSVAFSMDGKIETVLLDKLVDSDSPIHSYHHFTAQVKRAFSPVMRQIAAAKTVRYKLTIGGNELEATMPGGVHDNIRKLVKAAKYEDRYILIYGQ